MTCKEIHEQITAFVDDRVDEQEYRSKVEQHIKYCPDCRAAYEMELVTKIVVRDRTQRACASDELRKAIAGGMDRITAERGAEMMRQREKAREGWLDRFSSRYHSPAGVVVALLLIVGGGWLLFRAPGGGAGRLVVSEAGGGPALAPEAELGTPQNFFNKASNNYAAIRAGQLELQLETSDQGKLGEFFKERGVAYNVIFRPVRTPLAGGVVSQHGATRFAHMVYADHDTVIYVFEVPYDALVDGKVVYLTPDMLERLNGGEWIWEEPAPGNILGVYRDGSVVYAIVGNIPRPDMERLLAVQ